MRFAALTSLAAALILLSAAPAARGQRYGETSPSAGLPPIPQGMVGPQGTASQPPADTPQQPGVGSSFDGLPTAGHSTQGLPTGGLPAASPSRPASSALPQSGRPFGSSPTSYPSAGQSAPAAGQSARGRSYAPTTLMEGMMKRPTNSRLTGAPIRMDQVVASGQNRAGQTQRIYAYWDLCSSVADYYLGLAEASELSMHQQRLSVGNAELDKAIAKWRTRIGTSQLAAVAAQRRLANLMGVGTLPLPGDLPLCVSYYTFYDQAMAGRASREARDLNELIPLRHAELIDAAEAVARSESFLQSVQDRNAGGQGVLEALRLLALNRRAFVQIAKDYNRQITRYSELAAPGDIATGRLVAMLVERPRTASALSSPTAPSSATQSSAAGMPPTRPQTFRYGRAQ